MAKSGLRPLSIGEILDGTFTLYREHFGMLVLTAALCGLPSLLADFALPELLAILIGIAAGVVNFAALTWMAAELVLGRSVEMGTAIRFGVRNSPRIVVSMLCLGLVTMLAVGGSVGIVAGLVTVAALFGEGAKLGATVLGAILVLLLISYVFVRYFAAYQIVVLEKDRHFLQRSALLAKGAMWKIGTVWTVGSIVVSLPWLIVGIGAVVGIGTGIEGLGASEVDPEMSQAALVLMTIIPLLTWLVNALTAPFTAALGVLLYLDQRVRKDGLDVELAVTGLEVGRPGGKPLAA